MKAGNTLFMNEDDCYEVRYQEIKIDGFRYFVPDYARHRPAVRDVLNGNLYEPHTHVLVKKFFEKVKGSLVHAGTFFGDMLPGFSNSVDGKVYAFEPVLENFVLAKLCVEANQLENVILQNCALSDKFSNLRVNTSEGNNLHAGGASRIDNSGVICAAVPLDALGDDSIVMIQLDVEGHELVALKGAVQTIKKCRPVIAIEDNYRNCKNFLTDLQYEIVGEIPGLIIWVPAENDAYRRILKQCI